MYLNSNLFILFFTISTLCNTAASNITCEVLRNTFARSASKFISCAIDNSRPITLCQFCVNPFITMQESYINMTKFQVDNSTARCIDRYINVDRLGIVQTLHTNSLDLWNRAKCYQCFETVNGTLSPNKSQETITFGHLYDNLTSCISETHGNDSIVCPTCLPKYVDLDDYYISISNENDKIGVCMDIVDLMNVTRRDWSAHCCQYRRHNEYIFLTSSAGVLLLTVLFYLVTHSCSERKTPTIMQQRRFAESFNGR